MVCVLLINKDFLNEKPDAFLWHISLLFTMPTHILWLKFFSFSSILYFILEVLVLLVWGKATAVFQLKHFVVIKLINMNVICGIIGPIGIIILGIFYIMLTLSSLYLVVKNEKSLFVFFWILAILFFPYIGSTIYLGKYFISKNSAHS